MRALLAGLLAIAAFNVSASDSGSATMGVSLVIVASPEENMEAASTTLQDSSGRITPLTAEQSKQLLYDPQKVVTETQPDAEGVVRVLVRFPL